MKYRSLTIVKSLGDLVDDHIQVEVCLVHAFEAFAEVVKENLLVVNLLLSVPLDDEALGCLVFEGDAVVLLHGQGLVLFHGVKCER